MIMLKIDKQNENIAFNEESHVYFDVKKKKKKYISVTTMIEKFGQPFDKDFWSSYKSLEKLTFKSTLNESVGEKRYFFKNNHLNY